MKKWHLFYESDNESAQNFAFGTREELERFLFSINWGENGSHVIGIVEGNEFELVKSWAIKAIE